MISLSLLIVAFLFNAIFNERDGRSYVCLAVLMPTAAHFILAGDLGGYQYYGSVGAMCCISFALLEFLPDSPLVTSIQSIQVAGILANGFGVVMYYAWQEPMVYNVIMMVLIIIEWTRLMLRTKADGEHGATNFMRDIRANADLDNLGASK